jgi:hypothetical protein
MFALYAREANYNDPLASVMVGERPEPIVPECWVGVRVTHASLNRHDIFTLLGVTAQNEPILPSSGSRYGRGVATWKSIDHPTAHGRTRAHPRRTAGERCRGQNRAHLCIALAGPWPMRAGRGRERQNVPSS